VKRSSSRGRPPDADAGKSLNPRPDPFAPLTSQLLLVGDGHEVYLESVGRSDGISAVAGHSLYESRYQEIVSHMTKAMTVRTKVSVPAAAVRL
jgi:hypothetical protein